MIPGQPQGNSGLELRDIHLPEVPGIWPPAPGWWLLALLLLVACFYCLRFTIKYWHKQQQKKQILSLLDALENKTRDEADNIRLAKLSELMKQLALARFPGKQVSSLSGKAWLEFLDETGGSGMFSHGAGQVLAQGPYMKTVEQQPEWNRLTTLIKQWVAANA